MDTSAGQFTTIDEYVATLGPAMAERIEAIRQVAKEELPDATEAIKYKMPTFVLNGRNVVLFSAFKHHLSLFPASTEMMTAIPGMAEYAMSGKGTIQFPADKPLPLDLIRQIIRYLAKEAGVR